jgi:hypothetical protein
MICVQEWVEDYVEDRLLGDTLQKCRDKIKHSLELLEVSLWYLSMISQTLTDPSSSNPAPPHGTN